MLHVSSKTDHFRTVDKNIQLKIFKLYIPRQLKHYCLE